MCISNPGQGWGWKRTTACLALLLAPCIWFTLQAESPSNDAPQWDAAAARHLLSRVAFGGTPEQAARLASMPLADAVKSLLDEAEKAAPPARPVWVRDVWVNGNRHWSDMTAEEYLVIVRETQARTTNERNELKAWWLQHLIRTDAPLREAMTLFWHGQFTTASSKIGSLAPQALYQQNQTWRKHALGNFRTFLRAVTLDPAMLVYLDLEDSTKEHPNENYARELLELFTLGVGNYTEKDVLEIARALTGWTLDAPPGTVPVARPSDTSKPRSMLRDGLTPRFLPERHDGGIKSVLGATAKFDLDQVLDRIVAHAACGRHLASRLIQHFGARDPAGSLRERMARAFRDSNHEIRPMLEILLTSPEFYHPQARGNQIKSPIRLLVGACRDLKLQGEATPPLAALLVPLGQDLFNPPTVKGWPSGTAWVSATTLPLRARLGETLVRGEEPAPLAQLGRPRLAPLSRVPEEGAATLRRLLEIDAERAAMLRAKGLQLRFNSEALAPAALATDTRKLAEHLEQRLLVIPPRQATHQAVLSLCEEVPVTERVGQATILLLASPEYQLE